MRGLPRLGLATALVLFLVDQLVKWIITGPLGIDYLGAVREILPIFDLRFVQNVGVSLGLLRAESEIGRWALVVMTGAIAVAGVGWMWREPRRSDRAGARAGRRAGQYPRSRALRLCG